MPVQMLTQSRPFIRYNFFNIFSIYLIHFLWIGIIAAAGNYFIVIVTTHDNFLIILQNQRGESLMLKRKLKCLDFKTRIEKDLRGLRNINDGKISSKTIIFCYSKTEANTH